MMFTSAKFVITILVLKRESCLALMVNMSCTTGWLLQYSTENHDMAVLNLSGWVTMCSGVVAWHRLATRTSATWGKVRKLNKLVGWNKDRKIPKLLLSWTKQTQLRENKCNLLPVKIYFDIEKQRQNLKPTSSHFSTPFTHNPLYSLISKSSACSPATSWAAEVDR